MKLYLSGPISDVPDDNAPAFDRATRQLRAMGHEVISPIEVDRDKGESIRNKTWGFLLARDVQIIADENLDGIALLAGWEQSKGARLEVFEGILLKLAIYTWDGQYLERQLRHEIFDKIGETI